MPKILNFQNDPYVGVLTCEELTKAAHQVVSLNDGDLIWKHNEDTQPGLVLLDSHSAGFGTMELYFDSK
jgi:DNA-binding response OmpR family regulator